MSDTLINNPDIKRLLEAGKNRYDRTYWLGVGAGIEFAESILRDKALNSHRVPATIADMREKALMLAKQWNPSINTDIVIEQADKILAYLLKATSEAK